MHNRANSIQAAAQMLEELIPEARVETAHGQMPERALRKVMTDFVNNRIDVLACTTIIESGLDIPNANTIIIERSDTYGLADLYQLRGRVGRYTHRAQRRKKLRMQSAKDNRRCGAAGCNQSNYLQQPVYEGG